MSTPPPLDDQDARTQRHLACLDALIAQGLDLATHVHQQSTTPSDLCSALAAPGIAVPFITPDVIASFAQINQTVRRAILLSRKLAEPLPLTLVTARKRVTPDGDDTTRRETRADAIDPLRAEPHERVEFGDLGDDIGNRPIHEIIAEISRDLVVISTSDQARRTPQDLQTPTPRAAQPASPNEPTPTKPRPFTPRTERRDAPEPKTDTLHSYRKPELRPPKR